MKTAILAVFAAIVAVSIANPAPHVVDWVAVRANVHLLRDQMKDSLDQVRAIALADNAVIGGIIGGKLSGAAQEGYKIIGLLEEAVKNETLTEAEARVAFDQLKVALDGARQAVAADVAQLSAAAQTQIQDVFNTGYANAENIAKTIIQQLGQ